VRRLVEFLVGMLPLDAAGRRAVDETMADWKHEAQRASTMTSRAAISLRSALAVVATLARLTGRDLMAPRTWLLVASVVGVALASGAPHAARWSVSS